MQQGRLLTATKALLMFAEILKIGRVLEAHLILASHFTEKPPRGWPLHLGQVDVRTLESALGLPCPISVTWFRCFLSLSFLIYITRIILTSWVSCGVKQDNPGLLRSRN